MDRRWMYDCGKNIMVFFTTRSIVYIMDIKFQIIIGSGIGAVLVAYLYQQNKTDKKPLSMNYLAVFSLGLALGFAYVTYIHNGSNVPSVGGSVSLGSAMAAIDLSEPSF